MSDIETIFNNLNKWIDTNTDDPKYRYHKFEDKISKDIINKPIEKERENKHIVQQEESEIREFVEVLLTLPVSRRYNALEIGLGKYGGTHMLWRQLFENVTTIDFNGHRIKDFREKNNLDNRSKFICADSNEENTVKLLNNFYNFLFLDGDHIYESIKKDYQNYKSFILPGGIIVFHDILSDYYGVKQFIQDLSDGKIDGKKHEIHKICHSEVMGIGYLYV